MTDYGGFIRRARKAQGLRQIDLADGICSVDTISRIENGSQKPSGATFSLIVERLGVSGFSYGDFFDSISCELFELRFSIRGCFEENDMERLPLLLGEYSDRLEKASIWDEQFYAFARARYLFSLSGDMEEYLYSCRKAVEYTLNHEHNRIIRALTQTEIGIICELGIIYHKLGKEKESIKIFNRLIIHMIHHNGHGDNIRRIFAVIYNNAAISEYQNYESHARRHIDKALSFITESGGLLYLLRIMRNKCIITDMKNEDTINGKLLKAVFLQYNSARKSYDDFTSFMNEEMMLHVI